jgi:hypothetical protein
VAQLRAVRTVLRRLAAPAEGQLDAEQVFKETLLKGSRLTFPRHAQRKADAQVGGCVGYACRVCVATVMLNQELISSIGRPFRPHSHYHHQSRRG